MSESKTSKIKVSVIIPAYNAAHILPTSLGPVVHQSLNDIEIIIINDASTDNTLEILMRCQSQFPSLVKIIDSKENLGPGGARNLGIDAASGDYIGFADADDFVSDRLFERLYEKAIEGDYDIVDCGMIFKAEEKAIIYTGDNVTGTLDDIKRSRLIVGGGYLYTKLYKRYLFENPPVRMRNNCILEDSDILTYMFAKAKSIGNVKEILYQYNNEAESASKIQEPQKYCENIYNAMLANYERVHDLTNYQGIKMAVEYEIVQMYVYGLTMCLKAQMDGVKKERFDHIEWMKRLAAAKKKTITIPYEENKYVMEKIDKIDIRNIKDNDKRFEDI